MVDHINSHFFKRLIQLALPVSLQFLLHSSRYIADVLMLGRLGEDQLAAAGLCTSIHMLANSVIWALAGGIGLLCAQYVGARNERGVRRTMAVGITAGLVTMLPVALLFFALPRHVAYIVTNQKELISLSAQYLQITAALPILIGTIVAIGAGLNAIGKPHLNMIFTLISVVANVVLNWIFIFGNLGAPAMGLTGAATATVASSALELLAIIVYLKRSGSPVACGVDAFRKGLTHNTIRHFLKISIPIVIGGVAWHAGHFIYQAIYGHMGATEVAVITMITPIRTLCFSFFWGISSATGVIMGNHLGAGEFQEARYRSWALIGLGMLTSLMAATFIWLFRASILGMFDNLDYHTIHRAEQVLGVMLATIWILAINVVGIVGVLQSGADNRFILKMDMFCQWAVGIPLCWCGAFYLKLPLHWVYLAAFSEEFVKLFIALPRIHGGKWIRNLVGSCQMNRGHSEHS